MTIGEIAKELNISTYSIRFYEKEDLLRIPRNNRGIRDFDEEAITSLKAILHYRNVGMRLEDIKTVFKNFEKEDLLRIPRNNRGIRDFDEEAITSLKAILHYRNVGMRLEDIKTVFKNFENHELSVQLLKETKTELDQKIAELESTRDYLIYKIGLHERIAREEKKKT